MKSLLAFTKKEITSQLRSVRLIILGILFVLLGAMNTAIAKLTPLLLDAVSDTISQSGISITPVTVSALDSWMQFFKNIPLGLIVFILLESDIFTREYRSGTLIPPLTKGLARHNVVISKAVVLTTLWTLCYWLCFVITYCCNAYFWDNSVAQNLMFSVVCWWLFGLWVTVSAVFFSTVAKSNIIVLAGVGCSILALYLLSFIPELKAYLPIMLTDGNSLISGVEKAKTYNSAIIITGVLTIAYLAVSFPVFNKRNL